MSAAARLTANPRARWFGLVFISVAVALIIVDSTIINVAIPSIVDDLGITSTQVQWVQESYTLVFAALLLVFGTLADRFGRRRLLLTGVVVFALASVLAGLSESGGALIGARVLQGFGGAMILPTTLSIINATFRGKERGIAFAIWGSTIGGMAAVGPLLGGWLTTDFSWRWAFGINVPLGIIIVIGLFAFVAESRERDARRIDVVGAILSVITCASLVFGLIEGRTYGWWLASDGLSFGDWEWPFDLSPIPLAFAVTIVGATAFIAWGLRRQRLGKSTLFAFALFRIASFRNGNIAAMIVSLGEFGIILSLPLWLQNVLGYDALHTGYVLLGLAIGSFVASGFAGAFGGRFSAVTVVRVGIGAEIVGLVIVGLVISTGTPWYAIVGALFVYGFGVGLATAQLTGVVLKDVPVDQSGQGSGTQSTARQIGSALGIAVLGTILFSTLGGQLDARLEEQGVPVATRTQIVDAVVDSAGSAIPALEKQSTQAADDARQAFSEATRFSAFAAAGFLALGFLATLRLEGGGRPEDDVAPAAHATPGSCASPPSPAP
ncbi:DHA2 family efflux MFS transporter permease subunit [Glaciihabitans sp. dw_435]|uniref:DHA2 family efflux MFS transporter permease subunit n=1 Tax=Glaciihabitans sp. dw_435 TaxID=2720081 RepID=UPI0027DC9064|nr:DHA2 family efflux MFS transporter permease subunit [Glaciihabitans sp. dw_435]